MALACDARPRPSRAPGLPQLVDPSGRRGSEVTVDFGAVLVGSSFERTVRLDNLGRNPFFVNGAQVSGDRLEAVQFEFDDNSTDPMGLNASRTIKVRFTPDGAGDYRVDYRIGISQGSFPAVIVHVHGKGILLDCSQLPQAVDFGRVPTGVERELGVRILNPTNEAWHMAVGAIVGHGFSLYGVEPGDTTVPPAFGDNPGELAMRVRFKPEFYAPYEGLLPLSIPAACGPGIPLRGIGVDQVLFCDSHFDASDTSCGVDFGATNPGRKITKPVVFRNIGAVDITINYVSTSLPAGIGAPFATTGGVKSFRIPAGGAPTEIPLEFRPSASGVQTGAMLLSTSDRKSPRITVRLRAAGGGPWIDAAPRQVDFGDTALQTVKDRTLRISNIGFALAGGADALTFKNLKDGVWIPKRPEISDPDQFVVDWPADPNESIAAGDNLEIDVHFKPRLTGPQTATLHIYSNDPEQPVIDVVLNGTGWALPACDFEVKPAALDFGYVEYGQYRILSVAIINHAPNPALECLVADLDLVDSGGPFWLVNGAVSSTRVPGNGSLEILVGYSPFKPGKSPPSGPDKGKIAFYISSPTRTNNEIALSATPTNRRSLEANPPLLNFGSVARGCSSRVRTVEFTNNGKTAVSVESISVVNSASSAFRLSSPVPTLPMSLAPNAVLSVGVTFEPTVLDDQNAQLAVKLVGDATPYVVPLQAAGTLTSVQVDEFVQPSPPMLDLMLVVDDGPTMSDKSSRLSDSLQALATSYTLAQFAYQIGVTTTDASGTSADANGLLLPPTSDVDDTHPRVITPGTPDLAGLITGYLGTLWSGTNPKPLKAANLALSPPLIINENAQFLRPDADLAILMITDAADTDTRATSEYVAAFRGLKDFNRGRISVSGIIPLQDPGPTSDSGCTYAATDSARSSRLRDVITATGGISGDVCDASWTPAIEALLWRYWALRTGMVLRGRVDVSSGSPAVNITVDDQVFALTGSHRETCYSFDSTLNAIIFNPRCAPKPGSEIAVQYNMSCR